MNIVAMTRTLNEHDNIARFCEAYKWADRVVIADGGSEDDTVEIALSYPNVEVYSFHHRMPVQGGGWRNPEGLHCQYLLDCACIWGVPDILIFDDCDSVPNPTLQRGARDLFSNPSQDAWYVYRAYLWLDTGYYFPRLSTGGSMWAWRPSKWNIRANVANDRHPEMSVPKDENGRFLHENDWCLNPDQYRLLHYTWRTEDQVVAKIEKYNQSGLPQLYPLDNPGCGLLAALPAWAY